MFCGVKRIGFVGTFRHPIQFQEVKTSGHSMPFDCWKVVEPFRTGTRSPGSCSRSEIWILPQTTRAGSSRGGGVKAESVRPGILPPVWVCGFAQGTLCNLGDDRERVGVEQLVTLFLWFLVWFPSTRAQCATLLIGYWPCGLFRLASQGPPLGPGSGDGSQM